MESELQKFRRKKQLEEKKEVIKEKVKGYWDSFFDSLYKALLPSPSSEEFEGEENDDTKATKSKINPKGGISLSSASKDLSEVETEGASDDSRLTYLSIGLMTLTWLLFYIAFLKIEFGAVYFTISLLLFIYWNTKTSRRKKGEISAYSVFNKDCKSIDGALKSEHLEKQLLYRT